MKHFFNTIIILFASILIFVGCSDSNKEISKSINLSDYRDGLDISKSGTYEITGTLYGEKIEIDEGCDVHLIFSGVNIQNDDGEALESEEGSNVTIELKENTENILSGSGDAAINAKGNLELCGNGSLKISSLVKHGIECDGNITIDGGNYEISSFEHGIKSEAAIKVLSGNISIISETGKGIKAEKEYIGDGGNITIVSLNDEGLESKGALTINNGNYNITSYDDAINAGTSDSVKNEAENTMLSPPPFPEDFDGEIPTTPPEEFEGEVPRGNRPKKVPIEDGKIMIIPEGATTSGRGVPFEHERSHGGFGKVNADSVITINGGIVKINTFGEGDGIDSNGSLTINGGTVIIDGPEGLDNGSLDSDGEMIIENATVLCASSNGMTQYPRSMTQKSIIVDFDSALKKDTVITIKDAEQNTVIEHTVGVICERLYFTSPEIKDDVVYTVFVNWTEHSTTVATIPNGYLGGMRNPDSYMHKNIK